MELHEILIYGVAALGCFILAILSRAIVRRYSRARHRPHHKAESTIQGSGMGADKKALVIAQLQAAGIKVTSWLDTD